MLMNQANERDANLTLAEEQDFAATDVGKNSGGVAIQRDVSNWKDQELMVNVRYKNDASANYALTIESSSDSFSTTKLEKLITINPGGANTEFQTLKFGIAPSGDKIRLRAVKTAGNLTGVDAYFTPITPT